MWRRYARNAAVLEVSTALEQAREELADPVSDRVIEAFDAAHERGQSVVVDVLRTLADDVTKDLQLAEQIITGQTEVRAQAVVAVLLPFVVLALLVSTNDGFRAFYRTSAGFVVICVGAAMAFVGWKLINAIGRLPDRPAGPGPDEAGAMTGQVLAIAADRRRGRRLLGAGVAAYPGPSRAPPGPVHRAGPGPTRHRRCPQRATGSTSVWGPMVTAAANRLAAVLDAGTTSELELRLRRAGLTNVTVAGYRKRQLTYTVFGFVFGVAMALLLGLSTAAALIVAVAFGAAGALRWRAKVDGLTDDRRTLMRAEAHIVCQMLAVWLRTGDTPSGALDRLTQRAVGIVPGELENACSCSSNFFFSSAL